MHSSVGFHVTVFETVLTWTSLLILTHPASCGMVLPAGRDVGGIRFDATVHLHAPMVGTDATLFARYWIGRDFYHVAVVWAEPHVGNLNFPVYPPGLTVSSNHECFSLSSRIHSSVGRSFPKPLGNRGVFHHRFNNYPIDNIRFAEHDALASRVPVNCLENANDPNCLRTDTSIQSSGNPTEADARLVSVKAHWQDGRMVGLTHLDHDGNTTKRISYEYQEINGSSLLTREEVLLPETPIEVGYNDDGLIVTVGGRQAAIKQFRTSHHMGGRQCIVNYEAVRLGQTLLSLPVNILVRRADSGLLLRSVHMSNYTHVDLTSAECEKASRKFCQFSECEWRQRQLLLKYWYKPPGDVNEHDVQILKDLSRELTAAPAKGTTTGEKLRRVNMLMELDLMLGKHDSLVAHFDEYMAVLADERLDATLLTGGCSRINTAMRWCQFSAADRLLERWIQRVLRTQNPDTILPFVERQMAKGHFWIIASLLDESLASQHWGDAKFAGQVLRCVALHKVSELYQKADYITTDHGVAQVGWVASSIGVTNMERILRESLMEAKATFASMGQPSSPDQILEAQLNELCKTLSLCE